MTRIGILTGGGDCAGLDAIIRAAVRRGASTYDCEFVGLRNGWLGLLENDVVELTVDLTAGILTRGGTLLCTSRTNPVAAGEDGLAAIRSAAARNRLDAVIAIGGDGTLRAARDLSRRGFPLVAVPKTIDNDVAGTELSVGFATAVQTATDAIDRLQTTAESHNRVMVVEVMGREAGWIATYAGLAGGADLILIPERPFDLDTVCDQLRRRHARGRTFSIIVVAEGAEPSDIAFDGDPEPEFDTLTRLVPSGIGITLQHEIAARTGYDTRATILGHVLRGGTPTATDRILGTRFGIAAVDAVHAGRFGTMTALQGGRIVQLELERIPDAPKLVDPELFETASVFFG